MRTLLLRAMLLFLLPAFVLAAVAAGLFVGAQLSIRSWRDLWQEASWPDPSGVTSDSP